VSVGFLSFRNDTRIAVSVEQKLMARTDVKAMIEHIYNEFENLDELSPVLA